MGMGNGGLATIEASDGSLEYVRERKAANARVARVQEQHMEQSAVVARERALVTVQRRARRPAGRLF
jgi:hypothetical protein